jgi:hypothetical protein
MTTATKAFLRDYEVLMIPIGPQGVHVYQDETSYTLNGLRVEQPGPAQPATQPADKTPVKDQPPTPTSKDAPR